MVELKEGQVVRVRSDLKEGQVFGRMAVTRRKMHLAGKKLIVKHRLMRDDNEYRMSDEYNWHVDMFEPVESTLEIW